MKYFSILLTVFLFGCVASNPGVDSLREFNGKNPEVAFKSDMEDGKLHFLAVLGYAAQIPGVGMITRDICYKDIEVLFIDKTGDSFSDGSIDEIISLKSGANDYAAQYNSLLKTHLQQQGLSSCTDNEYWGKAFYELNDYIWGTPTRHGSGLGMHPTLPPEFTISLLDLELTEDMTQSACKIFKKNGISKTVQFHLDEHKKYDGEWKRTKVANFKCSNGNRSKLEYK